VALALLALGSTQTLSGWASAQITNAPAASAGLGLPDGNSTASASLAVTHTYAGGSTCVGAARTTTVACTGSFLPQTSLSTSTDTITNNSAAAPGQGYLEQIKTDSCGLVQLVNSTGSNADPMLPRYGVNFLQTDPWGTTSAIGLDGTTGYASDVVQSSPSGASHPKFSLGVWFKASGSSHGGGLLSFSANGDASGTAGAVPAIWMDSAGKLHFSAVFGSAPGLPANNVQVVSPASYRDGSWHFASMTFSTVPNQGDNSVITTITGYVDGSPLLPLSAVNVSSALGSPGYWHLGWADLTGLTPSTAPYFDGLLSGAYYLASSAQSAGTMSSLYSSASAAAYASLLSKVSALWMLGDDGTTTGSTPAYTATPSGTTWLPAQPLCATLNITWALGGSTVYNGSLNSLAGTWLPATPAPGPAPNGGTQASTITITPGATYKAAEAGLRLYVPLSYKIWPSGASTWIQTFTWSGGAQNVLVA
jgi:hypothetical protein